MDTQVFICYQNANRNINQKPPRGLHNQDIITTLPWFHTILELQQWGTEGPGADFKPKEMVAYGDIKGYIWIGFHMYAIRKKIPSQHSFWSKKFVLVGSYSSSYVLSFSHKSERTEAQIYESKGLQRGLTCMPHFLLKAAVDSFLGLHTISMNLISSMIFSSQIQKNGN